MAFDFATYIRSADWDLSEQNVTLGKSFSGSHQIVATGAAYWVASIALKIKPSDFSAYRAWKARRRGVLIGDMIGPNREWAGWPSTGSVPFGSGATFADGSSFSIESSARESAAAGETAITIDCVGNSSTWAEGRYFSFGGWLYIVTEATEITPDIASVTFRPPLREAVTMGDAPGGPPQTFMRLTSDDAGRIADNYSHEFEVNLSFMEVLNR